MIYKWILSDTMFYHSNIIHNAHRPFRTVDQMNQSLIDNINSVVHKDDPVLFVGNLCYPKIKDFSKLKGEILDKLNGKWEIVLGAYDHFKENQYGLFFKDVMDDLRNFKVQNLKYYQ